MVFLVSICTYQVPQHDMASLYSEYLDKRWVQLQAGSKFCLGNFLMLQMYHKWTENISPCHHFLVSREEAAGGSHSA